MKESLLYIPIIAAILVIWFRTEAYVEYSKLFKLNWLSAYKDYEAKKHDDCRLNYLGYLKQYHNSFFIRLITCPICLSCWLSVILPGTIFGINIFFDLFHPLWAALIPISVPACILLGNAIQLVIFIPSVIYMLGSLLIYSTINKLLN